MNSDQIAKELSMRRERFAAAALQGMLANPHQDYEEWTWQRYATQSCLAAEAMMDAFTQDLKELERRSAAKC